MRRVSREESIALLTSHTGNPFDYCCKKKTREHGTTNIPRTSRSLASSTSGGGVLLKRDETLLYYIVSISLPGEITSLNVFSVGCSYY